MNVSPIYGSIGAACLFLAAACFPLRDCDAAEPNPLLTIDQHRQTVVDRVVADWGVELARSNAGVSAEQLRTMLSDLRSDQLLAASLAGSLDGLRDVLASALVRDGAARTQAKSLGDTTDDVTYTPVAPCRLVDTRAATSAVYAAAGPFAPGEVRTYAAQGGSGVCLTQLPAGLSPAAIQLQVFGIPISPSSSGDIEILPQGATFGSTATEVYVGNVAFNTVSTTAKVNIANNEISVQVRGGGANVVLDVVGYF